MNNIHNDWRHTCFRNSADSHTDLSEITGGRRRSSLQALAQRYRWFSNMALIMTVMPILIRLNNNIHFPYETVIMIVMCAYFAICSAMDYWLYSGIKSIDCATMSVSEVARLARLYRRRHLQFIAILLPIAAGMVISLAYFSANIYMTIGVIMGSIVGAAIGYRQLLAFLADYRQLLQDD